MSSLYLCASVLEKYKGFGSEEQNQKNAFLESYATILEHLSKKLSHISESLIELLRCATAINTNVNITLLIDHVFYTITKED